VGSFHKKRGEQRQKRTRLDKGLGMAAGKEAGKIIKLCLDNRGAPSDGEKS